MVGRHRGSGKIRSWRLALTSHLLSSQHPSWCRRCPGPCTAPQGAGGRRGIPEQGGISPAVGCWLLASRGRLSRQGFLLFCESHVGGERALEPHASGLRSRLCHFLHCAASSSPLRHPDPRRHHLENEEDSRPKQCELTVSQ